MEAADKAESGDVEEIVADAPCQLPSFLGRPLASSSHCLSTSVEVLKSFMAQEERQPFPRRCDLFLKPLPASGYYGRPIMTSHMGYHGVGGGGYPFPCFYGFPPYDPCLHSQLYRTRSEPFVGQEKSDNPSSDSDRDDKIGILKKAKPTEPIKDITINNSLVFIPNLSDLAGNSDSKGISELSSKLIEDFNKLKDGLKEEAKETKMVQFDLSAVSPVKENLDNSYKSREQLSSLSTNDSLQWQPPSMSSPTSTTSARMEWDSAADVGYIEMDMNKEKLSTLERVTLQGIARKGNTEKKVVYKKTSRGERILQRIPSDLIEIEEKKPGPVMKETGTNPEHVEIRRQTSDSNTQTTEESTLTAETTEVRKPKPRKKREKVVAEPDDLPLPHLPEMKDQSTLVNTLDDVEPLRKLSTSSEEKKSPQRVKKLKKKNKEPARLQKMQDTLETTRESGEAEKSFESKGVQVKTSPKLTSSKNIQASGELNSLPKHLDNSKLSTTSGDVRTKATQFFGEGANSLPRGLDHGERSKKTEKSGLTRKALKQRREPADRDIVREKFFESQMVSRGTEVGNSLVTFKTASTSMTREFKNLPQSTLLDASTEMPTPTTATVGCQYSPKDDTQPTATVEGRTLRDAWTDTMDSQASSTQTAHSWVHGGAPVRESVVRPTRSFEYLPGDVYENSNNIREALPSETSQNVITESESSAESLERRQSDSEGGRENSGGTVVVDNSVTGAWLLVKGDAVDIIRREDDNVFFAMDGKRVRDLVHFFQIDGVDPIRCDYYRPQAVRKLMQRNNQLFQFYQGVSEISGKFKSGGDKEQESVQQPCKCTAAVQTDTITDNPELIQVLKGLHALLAEKRSDRRKLCEEKTSSSTSYSSLYAVINQTALQGKRATSTPQTSCCQPASVCVKSSTGTTGNSEESIYEKHTGYSGSLPPTPRHEFVSVASQSEHNPTIHQSTQMSQRNASKDSFTQIGATLRPPRMRQDQATQMSSRGGGKSAKGCQNCANVSCTCEESKKSTSSRKMLKTINGQVFSTYLDVDFSSSEILSSASVSVNGPKVKQQDKENIQCSVCRCRSENQDCVFCPCHMDKKTHIPKCDCHDKIPRYLIPGFCKCHKRNLRHVNKCKCEKLDSSGNNKCPCCEYFASRMRSQLLAAQITPKKKSPESLPAKNYFLKLEETEVSKDSSVVSEADQKPLEVVTIKIPVKRMGKAKVPCKQFYYSGEAQRNDDIEYLDDIVRKYRGAVSSRQQSAQSYAKGSLSERASTFSSYRTLQECLESNRPDFLKSAEYRRQVINERASEREKRKTDPKIVSRPIPPPNYVSKRIFTTAELHQQTRKHYKKLPEVTQKKEDQKKREMYRTNKLMADIYAKKLQLKTLRGQLNFSNSCDLLHM